MEVFPWRSRAALLLGRGVLQVLARTWRFRIVNAQAIDDLRGAKRNFIFSLWHGQLLPLLWHHRDEGVVLLISEHRDGELVAQYAINPDKAELSSTEPGTIGNDLVAYVCAHAPSSKR